MFETVVSLQRQGNKRERVPTLYSDQYSTGKLTLYNTLYSADSPYSKEAED